MGHLTLFEVLAVGYLTIYTTNIPGNLTKTFQKKSDYQESARGHGQFCYWLVHYVCYLTQANWELKGWLLALIAAIAKKKKFSYRSDHSDHMETWLFRVRSDDDRWDRTTLSCSLTCKISTLHDRSNAWKKYPFLRPRICHYREYPPGIRPLPIVLVKCWKVAHWNAKNVLLKFQKLPPKFLDIFT